MEETNFVLLWKEQYEKIDQALLINKRLLEESIRQKAASQLKSLLFGKAAGIVIAVCYLILLGTALYYAASNYTAAANYFIVSTGAIFLINLKALYDYIKHLVWINNIDYNGGITSIQQTLNRLQLSIVNHVRVMFLQLPFWTTFYLSSQWFPSAMSWGCIAFQALLTGSFAYAAWFLYTNLRISNLDKKWVTVLLSGTGGKKLARALAFYREIEAFKAGS